MTMFSQNGKQLIILNNCKYKFKYESKIKCYKRWECSNKKFRVKLVLNNEIITRKIILVSNVNRKELYQTKNF